LAWPTNSPRVRALFSAANSAILRTNLREELFQNICDAAVEGGEIVSATIFVAAIGERLQNTASAGEWVYTFEGLDNPLDGYPIEVQRVITEACHSDRPWVADKFRHDAMAGVWHEDGENGDFNTAIAIAFSVPNSGTGVIVLILKTPCAIDDEFADLCQCLAKNTAFALERFDLTEEKERVARMLSALSASNEAILRAETREHLFRLVCETAVLGGKFTMITIALAEPGTDILRIAAVSGPGSDLSRGIKMATSADCPEGRGLTGTAFRTREPCISNDYLADQRRTAFHGFARDTGAKSGAALPLLSRGLSVGVLLFMSADRDTFTPEFVELLQRLAANVSFALENFDRADERKQAEERIKYLATHDGLTGLPNRSMFSQLLSFSIRAAERYQRHCAVLFIDLDRFKIVNDSLGHAVGDALLIEVAARLRSNVRASDVVARLGGDEFVVVLNEVTESGQVAAVARSLLSVLSNPLELNGIECRVTASIGIAMFPEDGTDEQTLTKNADIAMYLAKAEGKNDVRFFSKEIETQSIERLTLEAGLRHALERNELRLHYQPKLDVATGQIAGVEALLRWMHPELGLLPPMSFIPLAEETGLIVPIGRWVMQTACAQHVAWLRDGLPPISMAINVSPRQFSDKNLLADIDEALAASGMDPMQLQIEITESMVMLNVERAIEVLDQIQSRGVRLAIDDFGTGYSSMSMMKRFPIDTIKIDRSFIRDVARNSEDKAIAQAIIDMGKALGLTVVAEGVETIEQDEFLRSHACDELQGFLFSKPAAANEVAKLIRGQRVSVPVFLEK
jgi:diguanylate cyclase (GGDEF)-like protein